VACAPAARLSARDPTERADLRAHFEAARVEGTVALYDTRDDTLICSDVARCRRAFIPASTFKIPHAVIALELGVMQDQTSQLPWDGQQYSVPDWNRDQTLASAMRVSCVPCFRDIARQIGRDRMQDWLVRLDYGNHDGSGPDELFWLNGRIRISPIEQVDFLWRLDTGRLPISERTVEIVRDLLRIDAGLWGKTGSVAPPENPPPAVGWFVGFVGELGQRVYFATLIDSRPPGVDIKPLRRSITQRILESVGDGPATQL
jgi:beta-lactamase class D